MIASMNNKRARDIVKSLLDSDGEYPERYEVAAKRLVDCLPYMNHQQLDNYLTAMAFAVRLGYAIAIRERLDQHVLKTITKQAAKSVGSQRSRSC